MTFLTATINQLEESKIYHEQQIEELQNQIDQVKLSQAYGEEAVSSVEEAIENINPEHLELLKEHLLSLFETQSIERTVEPPNEIELPVKEQEDTQKTRAKLLGIPDLTPTTFEDLAHNIVYSSDSRAYIGFHDRQQAEEFRERLEMPSMLDEAQIINNHKWEVKFYCDRSYIEELLHQLHNDNFEQDEDWTPAPASSTTGEAEQKAELDFQERLIRTASDIFYDPVESTCYLGFSAKGRADNYGSYLTRILDIAEKYIVTNKPRVTTNTKYELRLEAITEEDAKHLANFNLKRDYDHPDHREAREVWRTTRKREYPPSYTPDPKPTPLKELEQGDIVKRPCSDAVYQVIGMKKLEGQDKLYAEVECLEHKFEPHIGQTFFLDELILVEKCTEHTSAKNAAA